MQKPTNCIYQFILQRDFKLSRPITQKALQSELRDFMLSSAQFFIISPLLSDTLFKAFG